MMPLRMNILLAIFSILLFAQDASAKRFSSKFCEFELPPGWDCALEGTEYVCQSENADRKKESIIILAAKFRGEQDSLDAYMAYLKKTKEYTLPGGKRQISEPKNVSMANLNNHQWVDALHLASEVPGFYTRYLATVKEDLGVAVTFSVGKDLYSAYQPVIDKMVASLRVFRQAKTNLPAVERTARGEDPNFQDATFNPTAAMDAQFGGTKKRKGDQGGGDDFMLIVGVIAIAAIGALILKNKKKK
jgi:hypothetical protein